MIGLFDMVCFNVRDIPYVSWILALWIPAPLPILRPFIVFFSGIFLRYTNSIQIKFVRLPLFRKPNDCFMSTAEPSSRMQAMAKRPDNEV